MRPFDVQSIGIGQPADRVVAFLSRPENLPRWTSAFAAADERSACLVTPAGQMTISLRTVADARSGVVDWIMTFPDGTEAAARSRVTPNTSDTSVYTFVLLAPPGPLEELEGSLAAQKVLLSRELIRLKEVLETT